MVEGLLECKHGVEAANKKGYPLDAHTADSATWSFVPSRGEQQAFHAARRPPFGCSCIDWRASLVGNRRRRRGCPPGDISGRSRTAQGLSRPLRGENMADANPHQPGAQSAAEPACPPGDVGGRCAEQRPVIDAPLASRSGRASNGHREDAGDAAPTREVLILRDLQGFTYDEIAQLPNIPRGTVESRIHRARTTIRQRFQEYGGTEAKPPVTIREKRP